MWETSDMAGDILGKAVKEDGAERLDLWINRLYGRTLGTVEAVMDANPGLAELGVFPPAGTTIVLPRLDDDAGTSGAIYPWE